MGNNVVGMSGALVTRSGMNGQTDQTAGRTRKVGVDREQIATVLVQQRRRRKVAKRGERHEVSDHSTLAGQRASSSVG